MKKQWKKIKVAFALIIIIILGIMIRGVYQIRTDPEQTDCLILNSGWYQVIGDEEVSVSLPCAVTADDEGQVILYNDTLTEADVGKVLSIRGVQNDLEVWAGENLLYKYQDSGFLKNDQMKGKVWTDIDVSEEVCKESICFRYQTAAKSRLYVQAPVLGIAHAVMLKRFQESAVSIVLVIGMLGLSMGAMIIFGYLRSHQITEKITENRFLDVSIFLALCAVWCVLDSGIYQTYGKQNAIGTLISFYAFMLMSVPMVYFVKNTVEEKTGHIPQIWIFLLYGNAILQGIIHIIYGIPFVSMLFMTHMILFVGVVSMIALLCIEYRRCRMQELKICLNALVILGISGLTALTLYWLFSIYWYDTVFQIGILLYIAVLFRGLLVKVSGDIRFHLEQEVYERISVDDRMTGLKNRKAFESQLIEIQEETDESEETLLIFVDVTGLKQINDTYGMRAGDESVVRTARCIESVGRAFNELQSKYFRISGDEFAIVVTNPRKLPGEWEKSIKNEIEKENSRYRVGLRFGYSYRKKADGTFYSISDWKKKADDMLQLSEKDDGGQV